MTTPLITWIIHLSFIHFYTVIQGVYSFLYCQNPYSHMKHLFTKIRSNIAIWQYIAIHSNAIRNMALTHIVSPLVCMCVYVFVYVYVLCVCVHVRVYVCVYLCIVCMSYVCVCVFVCVHTYIHTIYTQTYTYTHTIQHTHIHGIMD